MMRLFGFLFALLFAGCAWSSAIPLSLPANVAAVPGGGFVTTAPTAFSGAAFNSGLTTQVAGRAVVVPAAYRFAANAASAAATAVRLNPVGLATVAVAAWLLPYGIQWLNDQWVTTPVAGSYPQTHYCYNGGSGAQNPNGVNCGADRTTLCEGWNPNAHYNSATGGCSMSGSGWGAPTQYTTCPANMVLNAGMCTLAPVPATPTDWGRVGSSPLPDAVANDLSNRGVGIAVQPVPNVGTIKVPLSDPYTDPVTGKRYQDVGYITPSATNPLVADLRTGKQELGANDQPATDPETSEPVKPEKADDPCLEHPNRAGCADLGEIPEMPDLEEQEKTISITPDGGWGADTAACPADLTRTLRSGGQTVAFSFEPVCDGADMFRPVIIGVAWITAILIAMGISRRAD